MQSTAVDVIDDPEAPVRAAKLVESVVGNAWATDPAGQFVFMTSAPLQLMDKDCAEFSIDRSDPALGWRHLVHPDDYAAAAKAWRASLKAGERFEVVHRFLESDRLYRLKRCSGQPIRNRAGAIVGWYGAILCCESLFASSATTAENSTEELPSTAVSPPIEHQLQQLVNAVPALIWSATADGTPSYINQRLEDNVGIKLPDLIDRGPSRSLADIHPDDASDIEVALSHSFATGEAFCSTYRQRRADGDYRWTEGRAEPLRDEAGIITQWYGVCVDVHDRVIAQQALQERERQLLQLVDTVPGLIWCLTPEGQPSYYSKQLVEWLGVRVEDLDTPDATRLTFAAATLVHPEDTEEVHKELMRCVRVGAPFYRRYRVRRHDGVFRWMEVRAQPLRDENDGIVQWYGMLIDIEDLMQTQQRLTEREQELSQLVDLVPCHIWRLSPSGEPVFLNKQMIDFLGTDLSRMEADGPSRLELLIETIHPDDAPEFRETLSRSIETGQSFSMQYRARRPADTAYRWMSGRAEPLRDKRGRIAQWVGLCHDIDVQMRLYGDIAEREAKIRRLVDSDIIGIVIWDLNGTLIDANDAFLRMVQYDRADIEAGIDWLNMTPPEWQAVHASEEAAELAATGKMQAREKEYFRKDGSRVPVLIGAACFEGQSSQGVAYILDLSEQKRAEAALRDRERELSQLVDMVPSYLWRITPDGVPVFFNKRLIDFLGLDVGSVDGQGQDRLASIIAAVIHPDDASDVSAAFAHSFATGERLSMKWRMRRADGGYRWMAASAEAMVDHEGNIAQWYGLCHDIDDQVLAEETLRQSKRQLEQMIDTLPVNILSFDSARRLTYASKRYLETVGHPPRGVHDFDTLARDVSHSDDLPTMLARATRGFETGEPFVNRFRRRCEDGVYRWIEARAQALRDANGAIVQWYIVSIDIEEEMQAQDALRERERFLWQLVETLPAMIDCAAPDGEPVYRSQQLRQFLGYELETLAQDGSRLAQTLDEGVHPDDLAAVKEDYSNSLRTGKPYARRHRLRRHDGEYRWMETRAAPMRNDEGEIVQWNVICLDIDSEVRIQEDLRLAQERLARASQAASLAELSASIAHEVNQPLAAVVWNSQACQRWLTAIPPNLERAQTTVARIIRDANAAADVVSRIRALFRQEIEPRNRALLAELISNVGRLLAGRTARTRIETHVDSDLPEIFVDALQIEQVLVNLIQNSMEAMEADSKSPCVQVRTTRDGDMIRVEVSDNGPGVLNPEKVFDPFFTTKQSGMGMGLAICRSIVESHSGRLWIESGRSGGATFTFTLPI